VSSSKARIPVMPYTESQVVLIQAIGAFMAMRVMRPKDRYSREEFATELIEQQDLHHGDLAGHNQVVVPKFTLEAILSFLWKLVGSWYWFASEARVNELFIMIHYFAYPHEGVHSLRRQELELLAARVNSILRTSEGNLIHNVERFSLPGLLFAVRETARIIYYRTSIKTTYFPQWLAATLELLAGNYYGGPELAVHTAENSWWETDYRYGHGISDEYVFGGVSTRQSLGKRDMHEHDNIMRDCHGRRALMTTRRILMNAQEASAERQRNVNFDGDNARHEIVHDPSIVHPGVHQVDAEESGIETDDNTDNSDIIVDMANVDE